MRVFISLVTLLQALNVVTATDTATALTFPSITTPKSRLERFPSIEQRLQLYMSNWYAAPCSIKDTFPIQNITQEEITIANITFGSSVIPDQTFWIHKNVIDDCARSEEEYNVDNPNILPETDHKIQFRLNMRMYCVDVLEMMELWNHHVHQGPPTIPLLIQFGDLKHSHIFGNVQIPHFKKFRSGTTQTQLTITTDKPCSAPPLSTFHSTNIYQPIIWKLATHRHYQNLQAVYRFDTEWDHKTPRAVWRGQLTGALGVFDSTKSDYDNCMNMFRCKLVYQSHNSTLVHAKVTTTRNRMATTIHGRELVADKITIQELMRYKALIMLEGNDVASGLKWALLSQSVVLMPPPKHTSWAMEELLLPWVHYIPIKDDASNVEEQMQWILDNDQAAKEISIRATLWMEDLCFHPDARREDRLIMEEMLTRYTAHFR